MHDAHSSTATDGEVSVSSRPVSSASTTVPKSSFAKMLGLSPSRVSQMIRQGLPVEANGRIDVARGRCWFQDNVDQGRSEAQQASTPQTAFKFDGRDEKKSVELELSKIELDKARGLLVDKAAVERAVFARARAERDAWATWPLRIAAQFAAELGVEESALLPILKRLVREQLTQLAETDLAGLAR